MAKKEKNPRRFYGLAKGLIRLTLAILRKPIINYFNLEYEPYTPQHKTFILIGNHTDFMDPGYEMIALNRYIRFVSADFLARQNFITKLLLDTLDGVIIKKRHAPSNELTDEIIANLKAGVPVGLHAEGILTTNGETGFMPENTGKLVKDSGVALITFRTVGGYFRGPRWAENGRNGPVYSKVVHEYSPEELQNYSVDEINEIIRKDTYVNAYEQQKMHPRKYPGEKLAEHVERTLYMCPKCRGVGTLHSKDDELTCECGYSLIYGEDCFFHENGGDVVFDNILDWDHWQRKAWKDKILSAESLILSEDRQKINKIINNQSTTLCEDGVISIYPDRFELLINGETVLLYLHDLKRVQNANKQNIVIVHKNGDHYYISCPYPRSSDKFVAAWYYLTDREYK